MSRVGVFWLGVGVRRIDPRGVATQAGSGRWRVVCDLVMRRHIVSFELGLAALATIGPLWFIFGSPTMGGPMVGGTPPFPWLAVILYGSVSSGMPSGGSG